MRCMPNVSSRKSSSTNTAMEKCFLINFYNEKKIFFPVTMVSNAVAEVIAIAAFVSVSLNTLEQHVNAPRLQAIA